MGATEPMKMFWMTMLQLGLMDTRQMVFRNICRLFTGIFAIQIIYLFHIEIYDRFIEQMKQFYNNLMNFIIDAT